MSKDHGKTKSGVPITDEYLREAVEKAEHGYDPAEVTVVSRRPGRRSLAGADGTSPRINLRITQELHDRASARAEREGKTVSEVAREALEHYVG